MPPITDTRPEQRPRVITYYQTHWQNDRFVSILPLFTEKTGITHVILAAIHINDEPGDIHLNDDPFEAPRHKEVWEEVRILQRANIPVLGLLGGAAQGSFQRLDGDTASFERYYEPFRKQIEWAQLDGLDLDVEEEMSLAGIVRLIDRLKADFGSDFLITMAPVASAMFGGRHLSGFSYFELEKAMGRHIAWYNAQFYCGWGSAETTEHYDAIIQKGWDPSKIVLGLITNPGNGDGYVFEDLLTATLAVLVDEYPGFGGVMGWEYFNAKTETAQDRPWLWSHRMSKIMNQQPLEPWSGP